MTRKLFRFVIFIGVIVAIVYFAMGAGNKYPRPSRLFYVSDFADVLTDGTTDLIIQNAENMFVVTEDEGEGRTQIVIATFLVDSLSEIAEYDRTELYREWEIGENDMGILVLLFFTESVEEDITYVHFEEIQVELGYQMEAYITTIEIAHAIDETILIEEDFNLGVVHLYFELSRLVYANAYPDVFEPFDYDMEEAALYLESYPEGELGWESDLPMNLLLYLFSPFASISGLLTYGGIALLVFFLGGGTIMTLGAGGSSGGKGVFRRRR